MAVHLNNLTMVHLLLQDHRVNPVEPENTPIRRAIQVRYIDIALMLLWHPEMNMHGVNEALRLACEDGNYELTKAIMEHPKANPNIICNVGPSRITPISIAVQYNHYRIFKLFLTHSLVNHCTSNVPQTCKCRCYSGF